MAFIDSDRWKNLSFIQICLYAVLLILLVIFVILFIVFCVLWAKNGSQSNSTANTSLSTYAVANGIIGFPPRLPNDGRYVQWTFLQMNDVYELLPLDEGRKGGLARVAYIRQLLLNENNNTITVLAGDLVSPSALGTAKVNGTALNGEQMIATMNTLGLDYMTFGNHEFDISANNLLARMNESNFTWISSNVFNLNSSQPFGSSIPQKLITIDGVRILIIAFTIPGTGTYVRVINESSLVAYAQDLLSEIPNGTYDVLVALTHLDIATDIELAANIPEINLIMGGHEHEDYYYLRGPTYTPIYKADANAYTVYIHRCAFNFDTKRFRIYSTLAQISNAVPEEAKTAAVANYWFNLGIAGFQALGFEPSQVVSCLPDGVELDGRSEAVRSSQTLLTDIICESMINATSASGTTIGVFNSGSIRIDDVLRGIVTQYDILRVLPFVNYILALSVPGQLLAQVLTTGMSLKGNGLFLSYQGVESSDGGTTWLVNGINIATSGVNYSVATIEYAKNYTALNNAAIIQRTNASQTKVLIDYLSVKYPPC
jgi:5'-nucleotidase/UDP-sugar diphosphatase